MVYSLKEMPPAEERWRVWNDTTGRGTGGEHWGGYGGELGVSPLTAFGGWKERDSLGGSWSPGGLMTTKR